MGSYRKEDGERNESSSRENGALERRNSSTPVFPGVSEEIFGRNVQSSSDVSASDYPNSESVGTSVVIPAGSEVIHEGSSVRSYRNECCESGTLASGFCGVSDNSYSFSPPSSVSKSHRSPAVGCSSTRGNCRDLGLTERLATILSGPGEGELLFPTDGGRTKMLQFLQALDQQTIGDCRADERLNPLLKLNVSGGAVEDRLLAYLRQDKKQGALVGGSRGQYSGCFEVDTTLFCSSVSSTSSIPHIHGSDSEASGTDKANCLTDLPEQEEHGDDTGDEQGGEEFR